MQKLQNTYKNLVTELNSYADKNYDQEKTFTTKIEALKEVTRLNVELKMLKKSSENKKPRFNRKNQVHEILIEKEVCTIKEISDELNITHRNVSSIICYLRKDNINIISTRVGGETFFNIED